VRQIRWTAETADQLEAAVQRIQQDNPTAAQNVAEAIIDRIKRLTNWQPFPALADPER
jgi:plasmid stabilization system protein ParE